MEWRGVRDLANYHASARYRPRHRVNTENGRKVCGGDGLIRTWIRMEKGYRSMFTILIPHSVVCTHHRVHEFEIYTRGIDVSFWGIFGHVDRSNGNANGRFHISIMFDSQFEIILYRKLWSSSLFSISSFSIDSKIINESSSRGIFFFDFTLLSNKCRFDANLGY